MSLRYGSRTYDVKIESDERGNWVISSHGKSVTGKSYTMAWTALIKLIDPEITLVKFPKE